MHTKSHAPATDAGKTHGAIGFKTSATKPAMETRTKKGNRDSTSSASPKPSGFAEAKAHWALARS